VSRAAELLEHARRALPPLDGKLTARGLEQPVEVIRDRWGVPHVYAQSIADAYFAQGFVVAQDRLFQVELSAKLGAGGLSSWFGEAALPADRWMIESGALAAAQRATANPGERSREIAHAFAAGIAAWVDVMPARPVEYELLDLDPDPLTPEDAETGLARAWFAASLTPHNWSFELVRLAAAERVGWEGVQALFPHAAQVPALVAPGKRWGPTASPLDLLREDPATGQGIGSNNWVVAGTRTGSGKPLLANDPHQPFSTPSLFYEVHLSAPGLEVRGVNVAFLPGVIIGHTPRTAWAITAALGDNQDLYVERLNSDGTAALHEGAWEPITTTTFEVEVAGRADPEVVELRETRHGPLLPAGHEATALLAATERRHDEAIAVRRTAADATFDLGFLHEMAVAGDFAAFREALRGWTVNETNVVFADVAGNIGYQFTGRYPVRRRGDGSLPVPGWTADHEWDGVVPFEELPWAHNPDEGFLVTANSRSHPETYPHHLSTDFHAPWRALRVTELLTDRDTHTVASFQAIQHDTVSVLARRLVPMLTSVEPVTERQAQALERLRAWGADVTLGDPAVAIYEVWVVHVTRRLVANALGDQLGSPLAQMVVNRLPELLSNPTALCFGRNGRAARDELLLEALDQALDELEVALGPEPDDWDWGDLHEVRFTWTPPAGTREAEGGDVDEMFTAGAFALAGDSTTVSPGHFVWTEGYAAGWGATWRQVIDLADIDASVGVSTHGQSSNPASPHWNDQLELRRADEYHPLPISRGAVDAVAEHTLWCLPEE